MEVDHFFTQEHVNLTMLDKKFVNVPTNITETHVNLKVVQEKDALLIVFL